MTKRFQLPGKGADAQGALYRWARAMGLPPPLYERISSAWRTKLCRREEVLFYEGDAPSDVYFIYNGRVKLVRKALGERQYILRVVTGPDMLGERALIAGQPYAASAQLMADSLICVLEGKRFFDLWRAEPELSRIFARRLARKLAEADGAAFDLAQRTIRELLAGLLARRLKPSCGATVRLSESRQELADLLGTSPEVISRTLGELAHKGLVSVEGRRIQVRDAAGLRAVGRLPQRGA